MSIQPISLAPLARLKEAVRLLEEVRTLDEVLHVRSVARAAEEWARAEQLGDDAERYAREVRVRAGRKAGEILSEMARDGTRRSSGVNGVTGRNTTPTIRDLGLTRPQAHRWQKLALVPADEFEKAVEMGKSERAIISKPRNQVGRQLRPLKTERGKQKRPTEKQSLNGLRQAAVDLQSLAEGLDGHHFGDWAQLYNVEEAQGWFDILAESLPVVSARLKRIQRERKETSGA